MKRKVTDEQVKAIMELTEQGLDSGEIGRMFGMTPSNVCYWIRKERKKNEPPVEKPILKCPDCKYYGRHTKTCDYIIITGNQRDCPKEDCNRYKKGAYAGDYKVGKICALQIHEKRDFKKFIYSQGIADWDSGYDFEVEE